MIERLQGGSSDGLNTHKWSCFKKIWDNVPGSWNPQNVCDPFARNCQIADKWSNDINPETSAKYHLDGLDFLKIIPSDEIQICIFDPPFSHVQLERKYKFEEESENIYTIPKYVSQCMSEIERILSPGGYLLKFGYNTTRHKPSFELIKGWVINFGGNRNDVIVTLWQMNQTKLELEFEEE